MENKLKILFENDDYFIIEKQAGITVNKSDTTNNEVTIQDLINQSKKIDINSDDAEFIDRSGIVHRLDKETSGILIIAKNSFSFRAIQKQFKNRLVDKSYVALAHGEIKPKNGEVNAPIGRLPWNRMRFGVLAGGREALTKYEVIKYYKFKNEILSLVRLFPKTGRTHQIRVHLKHLNYPIYSDPLYGGRKVSRDDRKNLSRIFLHAEQIVFLNPKTNEKVHYKSELSPELEKFLKLISTTSN